MADGYSRLLIAARAEESRSAARKSCIGDLSPAGLRLGDADLETESREFPVVSRSNVARLQALSHLLTALELIGWRWRWFRLRRLGFRDFEWFGRRRRSQRRA